VSATIGSTDPVLAAGQGSASVCRQPAAGTFPGLRAVTDTNGIAAEPSTASAIMPESKTEFMTVPLPTAYTITLDSSNLDLKSLVEGIGRATVAAGLSNERANEVIASVNEAVLNSIEHGYGAGKAGKVEVTCRVAHGELVTTVRDYGKGFDPPATADGGGFTTLKRLMDRVAIESAPGAGTAVHLAKLLE
jgi:anti-sigma regulatory factor (Ser/Thr protein kinase)